MAEDVTSNVLFYDFDHDQKFQEFVTGDYASRGSGRILRGVTNSLTSQPGAGFLHERNKIAYLAA